MQHKIVQAKTVFTCKDRAGQFHLAREGIGSDSQYFFITYFCCWLAGYLVSDTPECRVQ